MLLKAELSVLSLPNFSTILWYDGVSSWKKFQKFWVDELVIATFGGTEKFWNFQKIYSTT